jgi:hypothetical protein
VILQQVAGGAGISARFRWSKALLGPKDGINLAFYTPEKFLQVEATAIRVHRNGVLLEMGAGADYTIAESGGPGTGWDTVVLEAFPPRIWEKLTADYVAG